MSWSPAAEEERFNRVKHVAGFPSLAAAWCLRDAGLDARELDHVAIGRDPRANLGAKFCQTARRLRNPRYVLERVRNMQRVGDVRDDLAHALGVEKDALSARFHNVEHHQAHAASAFFVSPFEEAAILTMDGFGDFASILLAHGHGNHFHPSAGARGRAAPLRSRPRPSQASSLASRRRHHSSIRWSDVSHAPASNAWASVHS